MNYGKLIGKGSFSKVYRKGNEDKVTIISNDPVKECMACGWFPEDSLFPFVEAVDYDEYNVYEMKYYPKVKAPKKELTKRSYRLYKALRKYADNVPMCNNIHDSYSMHYKFADTLPKEFSKEKTLLREALDALSNCGSDMIFEISPRNISKTKRGKLVLLDCFFFRSSLIDNRSK